MQIKKCHSCGTTNTINTTRCKGCGWSLIGSKIYSTGDPEGVASGPGSKRKKRVWLGCVALLIVAAVAGGYLIKRKRSRELEAVLKASVALKSPTTVDLPKEIYRLKADPAHNRAESLVVPLAARILEKTGFITVDELRVRSTRTVSFVKCAPFEQGCFPGPVIPTGVPDAVYDIKVTLTPKGEDVAKEWEYVEKTEYKDFVRTPVSNRPWTFVEDGSDEIRGKWIVPIAEREFVAISSIPAYAFASNEFSIEFSWRWKLRPYLKGIECDKPEMDRWYVDQSSIIHTHKIYSGTANFVRTNGRLEAVNVSFKED